MDFDSECEKMVREMFPRFLPPADCFEEDTPLDVPCQEMSSKKRSRKRHRAGHSKAQVETRCGTLEEILSLPNGTQVSTTNITSIDVWHIRLIVTPGSMISGLAVFKLLEMASLRIPVLDPGDDEEIKAKFVRQELSQSCDVFLPIFFQNHWTLAFFQHSKRVMNFFDSLHPGKESPHSDFARAFCDEVNRRLSVEKMLSFENIRCPSQDPTDNTCGLHVVENAELISQNLPFPPVRDMSGKRKGLAERLLFGRKSEKKKVVLRKVESDGEDDDIVLC